MHALAIASLAIAGFGSAYALGAMLVVRSFSRKRTVAAPPALPGVTLLKPLYGAEPGLYENLEAFCIQDYAAPVQVLFGVHDSNDSVVPIVERLIQEHPKSDIELVFSTSVRGANPKVANLAGMQKRIQHDVVIVSDSDVTVPNDYVARTVAALDEPGVGLVTCLYHGIAEGGLPAHLASMAVDYHFLPNVLVGIATGLARPCFGATIALRRETLRSVGGFEAFLDALADDNAMGDAVRATGLEVVVAPFVVGHRCVECSLGELVRHEIRWARTIRAVSPVGYAGSIVTYPLPFALIGGFATGSPLIGTLFTITAIACRLALQIQVDRVLRVSSERWWLGPARELLAFVVHILGFFVNVVSWRGKRFRVHADGTLVPLPQSTP